MPDEKPEVVPDIYCNAVQMGISPYDLMIELQRVSPSQGGEEKPLLVGRIRMSLEHAKVFAIVLERTLRGYEDQTKGAIPVHPNVLRELGISKAEDW